MHSAPRIARPAAAAAALFAAGLAVFASPLSLSAQRPATASRAPMARVNPGTAPWTRVPRDQVAALCGLDPAILEAADQTLAATPYVVVRYGRLCWEHGATDETYAVMSITKSMGSLLFGITSTHSSVSDEDPVTKWLTTEELGQINPNAKLAHVLSMTSTKPDLSWGNKGAWSYDASGNREINRLVTVMDKVIAQEPARFAGATSACDVAKQMLIDKLGMVGSNWCSRSIGAGLQSTVRDMARMGMLVLQRGWYNGERLISEEYMYRMTHPAFPDTNTAYGYLLYNNAMENWRYSTGRNDPAGTPVAVWPKYPHAPFFEAPHCNGASPNCAGGLDVGANWGQGAGGQRFVVHRGLDLVMAIRDDRSNNGHVNVWNAVRPALVALDPRFAGDEAAFTAVYAKGEYAPDLQGVVAGSR
jgi:CubicO group peptidase (beta-lactamase class C family)